jgi:polysaccharide export outer membrane protein
MKFRNLFAVKKNIFLYLLVLISGLLVNVQAQDNPPVNPVSSNPNPQQNIILSTDEDYLAGPNDILDIRVNDAPELSGLYQLNSKGAFTLPVVGSIEAKDKTVEQITQILSSRLKGGGYLINPIVLVKISQSNRRAFFIQGAVRRPGTYQIEGRVSLLKLITIAGGLADEHGPAAFVMQEKNESKTKPGTSSVSNNPNARNDYEMIKVNLSQLLKGELNKNLEISAGDIVHIPVAEEFFVAGEVKKPGSFPLKESTTLQQAISLAGGLSETSGPVAFLVHDKQEETDPDGEDFKIDEINLNQLFRGQLNKNIIIEPRDFVFITQAGTFYVTGEVKEPGAFPITREGITVRQAISLAKGTNYEANLKKSVIFRRNQTGGRDEIPVDIAAIMKGEKEDSPLLSDDIIVIPNSKGKAITKSLLQILTQSVPSLLLRR